MVTAGFQNYGVGDYISNTNQQRYRHAITIDMFCNTFYREEEFCCDDNIIVLQNSNLNKYQMLFIVPLIEMRKPSYNYGNQYRLKDLDSHIIMLPIDDLGNPDYNFMEQYIKSLPFSLAI